MVLNRAIPCLLINYDGLYKTIQFKNPQYIGDPINAVKIFNEKEVDELIILDITATKQKRDPNYDLLKQIASECFMPLAYGGGIHTLAQAAQLFEIGIEKIVLNYSAVNNPQLIKEISNIYGSQSVVVSIDIKKNLFGKNTVYTLNGTQKVDKKAIEIAQYTEQMGAGELMITAIDKEGTWQGFDIESIKQITQAVNIPVIASGGCGNLDDIKKAVNEAGASAVAIGSMAVFQKKGMGVLISFPSSSEIEEVLKN